MDVLLSLVLLVVCVFAVRGLWLAWRHSKLRNRKRFELLERTIRRHDRLLGEWWGYYYTGQPRDVECEVDVTAYSDRDRQVFRWMRRRYDWACHLAPEPQAG